MFDAKIRTKKDSLNTGRKKSLFFLWGFSIIFVERLSNMRFLGNILWLLLGGIVIALIYYLVGIIMCITIIGIPFGIQLFKFGTYSLWPFGNQLVDKPNQPGCVSVVMDVVWILFGWWEIAVMHLVFGLLCCITVVGIPFGIQHFKMIIPTLLPFGKEIRPVRR